MLDSRRAPRVFLSYAWESVQFRNQVKGLATRLRSDGIDVRLDAWHLAGKTIPEFMNAEVRHADSLLVVCSPEYKRKVHAMEDGRTSGVGWECMLVTANMYESNFRESVIPIILRGSWNQSAPLFMQGLPYFDLSNKATFEKTYLDLVRRLTGNEERAPALGSLPDDIESGSAFSSTGKFPYASYDFATGQDDQLEEMPPGSNLDQDSEASSQLFSEPIKNFLGRNNPLESLHAGLKRLTDEQYVVIDFLRYQKRVRVSGCAGSGKTLVAAEKALRLASGGRVVLFLCHNPQLADHIRLNLTRGGSVQVIDFCSWVREAAGTSSAQGSSWTHYDEPDDETLDRAAQNLPKYEAIIVDEAQDFRGKWWSVVESALQPDAFFYIFDDDQQALVPTTSVYPKIDTRLDLSKNCRNAERVFELMRSLTRSLPETRLPGGKAKLRVYGTSGETVAISGAIRELHSQQLTGKTVVLWAGNEPVEDSPIANFEVMLKVSGSWQAEIARKLEQVMTSYDSRGVRMPTRQALAHGLQKLSKEPYPTAEDIEQVQEIARFFRVSDEIKRVIRASRFRDRFSWNERPDAFGFFATNAKQNPVWGAEVVLRLQSEDWHAGLPTPKKIRIVPYWLASSETEIPLYSVADFKGLEADVVVMIARGRTLAFRESLYVGISRARAMLYLLIDQPTKGDLPSFFAWD